MANIKGIDISWANSNLDYKKLWNSGVKFAIIRTGYRQKTDDLFHTHMKGCLEAGIKVGAYTYCKARDVYEAKREADYAKTLLDMYPNQIDYPVFYDMEDQSIEPLEKGVLTEIAATFLAEMEGYGYTAGIYANPSWLENKLDKKRFMGFYPIWLAHWTQDPDKPTKYDYGQAIWQWGASNIQGAPSAIDMDISYVDFSVPKAPMKTVELYVNGVYKSEGIARIRQQPNLNGKEISRCVRGGLYIALDFRTDERGFTWFRHESGWSCLNDVDNAKLFTYIAPTKYK